MKRVSVILFALVSVCLLTAYATIQDNRPSQAQKEHRDAKYSDPKHPGLIGQYPNGITREVNPPLPLLTPAGADLSPMRAEALNIRKQVVCSSDVVIRGIVSLVNSYVTSDGSSIYSVYKVKIADRLKGDVSGDEIEVTGPGGAVYINGKLFSYKTYTAQLQRGFEYVLFLKYQKSIGDYELIQNEGIYDLQPDKEGLVRLDAKQPYHVQRNADIGVPTNLGSLTTEVKSTVCQ